MADQLAAAFDWWRAAGIDLDYTDEPQTWLAPPPLAEGERAAPPPRPARPKPAAPEVPRIGGAAAAYPADLAAFHSWWLSEPSLDNGQTFARVPPRGNAQARLMVLVPEPEEQDGERLLSGPEGQLLDAMLAAMGLSDSEVYVASVLPRRTPLADWAGLAQGGLAQVLAHHIALAAPQRIVSFGETISPLLGHDPTQNAAVFAQLNHEGTQTPLWRARSLAHLLARPAARAALWAQWLEWTG